jgi:YidC/Oxa1 family membrane protein insertase
LSEIHNPDFASRNSGSNDGGRAVALLVLMVMLIFGLKYSGQPKQSAPNLPGQVQIHSVHQWMNRVTSQSASGKPIASSSVFGWLSFIAKPLYLALRLLHDHGIGNWGWSIIVLTVIFNSLMIWPRLMSMKSSLKMMRIQPKVDALKKRYAHLKVNDPQRAEMNVEMLALYKAEGANLFGGCLPLLLQMPLLLAYMSVLRSAAELHHAQWFWLRDLSLPDPLHVLPLLIIASMVLTQLITPAPGMNASQRRIFAILMPAIVGLSLWRYASGLSLYWVTGNIINLLIQVAINRSKLGREMHALAAARTLGI